MTQTSVSNSYMFGKLVLPSDACGPRTLLALTGALNLDMCYYWSINSNYQFSFSPTPKQFLGSQLQYQCNWEQLIQQTNKQTIQKKLPKNVIMYLGSRALWKYMMATMPIYFNHSCDYHIHLIRINFPHIKMSEDANILKSHINHNRNAKNGEECRQNESANEPSYTIFIFIWSLSIALISNVTWYQYISILCKSQWEH